MIMGILLLMDTVINNHENIFTRTVLSLAFRILIFDPMYLFLSTNLFFQ